jgi:hypothetical protein
VLGILLNPEVAFPLLSSSVSNTRMESLLRISVCRGAVAYSSSIFLHSHANWSDQAMLASDPSSCVILLNAIAERDVRGSPSRSRQLQIIPVPGKLGGAAV